MKFHFNCYAVVEIQHPDDPDDLMPELRGFVASREDAQAIYDADLAADTIALDKHRKKFPFMHRFDTGSERPKPRRYELVALANVEFRWLSELDTMLEKAAVAQFKGVGKQFEVSA